MIVFFLVLTICILTHSDYSLYYALTGLNLWFQKMIPTLLPFMILSGIMIEMSLTEKFTTFLYPIIKPLFRISKNACYVMFMGFLCGFPMGAKTISEMLRRNRITNGEASFLLAFCNNIGPVYFCGFVLPLLEIPLSSAGPYLFAMYVLPLLYGALLRYTLYRGLYRDFSPAASLQQNQEKHTTDPPAYQLQNNKYTGSGKLLSLLNAADSAIPASLQSILTLGGYMILFNVLNLLPHIVMGRQPVFFGPILEITGGLQQLGNKAPLYTLILLPFGGLCCIAQTHSCIKNTGLSIKSYVLHKLILTGITMLYYAGCILISL